jgi:signal transduction histidine kinase/putative methionine-R-sulfoxide reductase with GAF domain
MTWRYASSTLPCNGCVGGRPVGVRKKLIGLVLLVLLPLVLLDAVQIYSRAHRRQQEDLQDSLEFAGAIGTAFDNYLDNLWTAELALGTSLAYRGLSTGDAEALLQEQLTHHSAVVRFTWVNPDLQVLAGTDPRSYGMQLADREHIQGILAGESTNISNLMESRVTGQPIITVSRGIWQGHKLLGIIVAAVDARKLGVALPAPRTGRNLFGLVDRQGMLVYRSTDPDLDWGRRQLNGDGPAAGALRGDKTVLAEYQSAVDHTWRMGAAVPIPSVGWASYATSSIADVQAMARAEMFRSMAVLALVVIAAGVGVLMLEGRIVRPILALQGAALAIAAGQRDARVEPAGEQELMAAARTFNEMAEQMQESEAQLRTRAEQQGAVAALGQHALAGTPLAAVMEEAVHLLTELLRVEYCSVLELLPQGDTMLLRAGSGWEAGLAGHLTVPVDFTSQAGYSLLSHEPVITADLRQESRFRPHRLLLDLGVISGMTVIIHGSAGPYGVLAANTTGRRTFTVDDVAFLQAVANVLGTAVQGAHAEADRTELLASERAARADAEALTADLRTRARQQAAVADLGRLALDVTGTVMPWLDELARVVADILEVEFCSLVELRDDLNSLVLKAGVGWPAGAIGHFRTTIDGSMQAAQTLRTGGPLVVDDLRAREDLWIPPELAERGVVSALSVVIQGQRRSLGVLSVHATRPRAFTPDDVNFLEAVAHLAATTIERSVSNRLVATQHTISEILAGTASRRHAIPAVLQAVGEGVWWEMGALWQAERSSGEFACSHLWVDPAVAESDRAALDVECGQPLAYGEFGDGQGDDARWVADLAADPGFSRRPALLAAGFNSAVWMPITVGSEVLGALAFCGREVRTRNDDSMRLLTMVSRQLGQYLERIRAEAELRTLNAELEGRVAERTAELAAANLELEAFTSSASHDLRAPLRTIAGFGQALAEDCGSALDANGHDYLRRIREASHRMAQLIDDLLLLSRVTRAGMCREAVDLTALAAAVAEDLTRAEAGRTGTRFSIKPGLAAHGDERLLRVALENLLGNAWKFTAGKAEAAIAFGSLEQEGKLVYFVQDNGAGFDMAYADKLFAPFQRLHSNAEFDGSGVGLATVKRIILKHGGQVWGEGVTGCGATFYFTL